MSHALARFRRTACGALFLLAIAASTERAAAGTHGFAPGETLPVFTYHGEDGVRHTTAELRGKWWLLKRGAEWCAPCVTERPSVETFMKAHPEVPVVMLVSTRPGGDSDLEGALRRDLDFQRRKGWRTDAFAVPDGREPSIRELPTPKPLTDLPLTIVVDPQGVVAAAWSSTYQYQRHYVRHGIVGKAEPEFRDYVEAVLACKGAKGVTATPAAQEIARSFDASCL